MSKVINFFAGPGTGKSTTTAMTFGKLKMEGYNIEMATEFAKDLTWEGRTKALSFQPYITGKQMYKIHRLMGEVDAILTDSPILMGMIYATEDMPGSYCTFLHDMFCQWDTVNIFLERDLALRGYNLKGRNQDLSEAIALDGEIRDMLDDWQVPYTTVKIMPNDMTAEVCAQIVKEALV